MMDIWHYSTIIIPMFAAALISLLVAARAFRMRRSAGAPFLVLLMLAVAVWLIVYGIWLYSADQAMKLPIAKIQYLGVVTVPVAWLLFALDYTKKRRWRGRKHAWLLFVIPLTTLILAWTNEYHHLIWHSYDFYQRGPFLLTQIQYGGWFWVNTAYSYACLLVGGALIFQSVVFAPVIYRWQAVCLVMAVLLPWLGNFLYVFKIGVLKGIDLTPLAFMLSGLLLAIALFRLRLLDVVPFARKQLMDSMPDAIIIVDLENKIIEMNPAAMQMVDFKPNGVTGKLFDTVFADYPLLLETVLNEDVAQKKITLKGDHSQRTFELRIFPLYYESERISGKVITLRDITEQVKFEKRLKFLHQQFKEVNRKLTLAYSETKAQKDALRDFLEGEQAISLMNNHGEILGMTNQMLQLTRFTRMELIGTKLIRLVESDARPRMRHAIKQALIEGRYDLQLRLHKDNHNNALYNVQIATVNMEKEKWLLALFRLALEE